MRPKITETPQKEAVNSQHEKRKYPDKVKPKTMQDAIMDILIRASIDKLKDVPFFTIQEL